VRVLETPEHVQFVEDHALIAPDNLLQNDLDRDPAIGTFRLPDDAICASTEGAPKTVFRPRITTC
jgi:hypothetical protein